RLIDRARDRKMSRGFERRIGPDGRQSGNLYIRRRGGERLGLKARPSAKDVGAVFRPSAQMRQAAERVALAYGLRSDWPQRRGQSLCCWASTTSAFQLPCLESLRAGTGLFIGYQ